jgi:hypothetical protein
MTLSNEEYPQRFKLTGPGQTLPFHFYVAEASWILVTKYSAGVRTDLTLGADYTVVLAGDLRGGWVTLAEDQGAEDDVIVIGLNIPVSQLTDYKFRAAFDQDVLKDSLNKIVQLCRQVDHGILRSLKMPLEVAYAGQGVLRNRKGKVLQSNEDGVLVLRDPIVIFTDEVRDLEATSGDIPVSYASMVTLTPDTPCQATMALEIYLLWDPNDGSPSDDQKTLFIGITQDGQASTTEGAGFTIGPSDWDELRPGLLSHLREFPVFFLPDDEDEAVIRTWAGVNPYSGHPADQGEYGFTLELLMKRYPGYGTNPTLRLTSTSAPVGGVDGYTGAGAFVLGTDTLYYGANPGGARTFNVSQPNPGQPAVDQWVINPWVASGSVPVTLEIKGYGYAHTAPVLEAITFVPYGDCGSIPPINWGVFVSGPYFDTYAGEIAEHGLTDIGSTGYKGYELTPTVVE